MRAHCKDTLAFKNWFELNAGFGASNFAQNGNIDYGRSNFSYCFGIGFIHSTSNKMRLRNEIAYRRMGHSRAVNFYDETGSLIRANIVSMNVPYIQWRPSIDIGTKKLTSYLGGYLGVRLPTKVKSNFLQSAVEVLEEDYDNALSTFDWGACAGIKVNLGAPKRNQIYMTLELSHGLMNINSKDNRVILTERIRNVSALVGMGICLR
jgi:hypothetical protein